MTGRKHREAVFGFAENEEAASQLAQSLALPFETVNVHHFPDGESLVRLPAYADHVILCRSLDRPNDKLIEVILAASELRRAGARHIILVAPYLAYMRQDIAFHPGEAVSQKIIGDLLAGYVDRVISVNPHLHRTHDLGAVFGGKPATALNAAATIGAYLKDIGLGQDCVVVGPDEESGTIIDPVAAAAGMTGLVGHKVRRGDRDVSIELPDVPDLAGRRAVIVDDVISSGATILECAARLRARGVSDIQVVGVHALFGPDVMARFRQAGIGEVLSCDGVPHPTNRIALGPLLAAAIRQGDRS